MKGGITKAQFEILYEELCKLHNREIEFNARLHGAEFESSEEVTPTKEKTDPAIPLFGDPEEYANLTPEEQIEKTNQMLGKHKNWVATKKV